MKIEQEAILSPINILIISSPEELRPKYTEMRLKSRYIALGINDKQILVRLFNFSDISMRDVKYNILSEAQDLLSIPPDEIEYDYQVFPEDKKTIKGVFICAPKKVVHEYLLEINRLRLIPIKMTTTLLAGVNSFVIKRQKYGAVFSVVDFSQEGIINIAVFQNRQCIFLRQVPYQTIQEAKFAVVQSLRSACTQSVLKGYDNIYFIGDVPDKDIVIEEIGKVFEKPVEAIAYTSPKMSSRTRNNFFTLNLFKNYVLPIKLRNLVLISLYIAILQLLLMSIFFAIDIWSDETKIKKLQNSFSLKDYEQAVSLLEKLE